MDTLVMGQTSKHFPNLRDVAIYCDCSMMSVTRALRGGGGTRLSAILTSAKRMGYGCCQCQRTVNLPVSVRVSKGRRPLTYSFCSIDCAVTFLNDNRKSHELTNY